MDGRTSNEPLDLNLARGFFKHISMPEDPVRTNTRPSFDFSSPELVDFFFVTQVG